jgi:hypothetical protein
LTGTLYLGLKRYGFRTTLDQSDVSAPKAENIVIVVDRRDPGKNVALSLEFRSEEHATQPGLRGLISTSGGSLPIGPGWRHVWHQSKNPAFGGRSRTLNIAFDNLEADGPQGHGFAIIKLGGNGLARWAAMLADGSRVTGSFPASPQGEVPLYSVVRYGNGGSIYALLGLEGVGQLLKVAEAPRPNGRWIKRSTAGSRRPDRLEPVGFDVEVDVSGAEYFKPGRGEMLFGNPGATLPLSLDLSAAGVETLDQLGGEDPTSLESELQPGNKLVVTESLPVRIAPRLASASGLFGGRVTLKDADPLGGGRPIARPLAFNGLYIPDLDDPANSAIRGFFLLPELPDAAGEKPTTTPVQSGALSIRP